MEAPAIYTDLDASLAAGGMHQRAFALFIERDNAALRAIRRDPAAGNIGRPVSVSVAEQTIAGMVSCTVEEGPTMACGKRTFRDFWSLDGKQISRCDVGRALMRPLP